MLKHSVIPDKHPTSTGDVVVRLLLCIYLVDFELDDEVRTRERERVTKTIVY